MHLACLEHTLGIQAVGSRLSLRILFVIKNGHTVCNGGQPCSPPIVTYHCKNLSVREVFFYCCETSFVCKEVDFLDKV